MTNTQTARTNTDQAARDREVIESLREQAGGRLSDQDNSRPTVARLNVIVEDLLAGRSLQETAQKMGQPTTDENVNLVLGVVARFGTWVTHTMEVNDVEPLFASILEAKAPGSAEEARQKGHIVIPQGYEPDRNSGRDVARALAAIIANRPTPESVARFVDRTYRLRSSTLTHQMVSSVWSFAARNRLDRITKVSDDPIFHQQVVAAFDLLDVSRTDALRSIERLLAVRHPLDSDDIETVIAELSRIRWVSEAEITRLLRTAETARQRPAGIAVLERELRLLAARVDREPWNISSVGKLNAGQIRRIATLGGLAVDAPTRTNEAVIRTTLRTMGLSSDADKLVPEALRATERNLLDEFWTILQSRVDGDITWSEQLEELLA
jgi:hypothetical protein